MTDRALGETEFVRRQRHAPMPRGSFERHEAIEGRESSHNSSMNEIHAAVNW
jgi:hypothetical protein